MALGIRILSTFTSLLMSKFGFLFAERAFEDHENLVEPLSAWIRDSENKVHFQEREEKYEVFKNPQVSASAVCTFVKQHTLAE